VADPVSRNPLVFDPQQPPCAVIAVGMLGIVVSVVTRGQKRVRESEASADMSQLLPPPPLVDTQTLSPVNDLREQAGHQDDRLHSNQGARFQKRFPPELRRNQVGGIDMCYT